MQNLLDDFINNPKDFRHLIEKDENYYLNRLHRLNSNLINNLAKALIAYYHKEYYATLDKIIKVNDENWGEYHFYNQDLLDEYLDIAENELQVFSETDLKILLSILDISFLFLKNATDVNDFESTLDAFFELKTKLESNNFTKINNRNVIIDNDKPYIQDITVTIER